MGWHRLFLYAVLLFSVCFAINGCSASEKVLNSTYFISYTTQVSDGRGEVLFNGLGPGIGNITLTLQKVILTQNDVRDVEQQIARKLNTKGEQNLQIVRIISFQLIRQFVTFTSKE